MWVCWDPDECRALKIYRSVWDPDGCESPQAERPILRPVFDSREIVKTPDMSPEIVVRAGAAFPDRDQRMPDPFLQIALRIRKISGRSSADPRPRADPSSPKVVDPCILETPRIRRLPAVPQMSALKASEAQELMQSQTTQKDSRYLRVSERKHGKSLHA